jgi:hypothetical protein
MKVEVPVHRNPDRIHVNYSQGRGHVTLPATIKIPGRQRKRIPVVLDLTMEQAEAIRKALEFNGMWAGDGYVHYDWPVEETKKQKRAKVKKP